MADPSHLAMLLEGVEAWNDWREANPEMVPNLEGVDLSPDAVIGTPLHEIDSYGEPRVNLRRANLERSDLRMAILRKGHLTEANLKEADLEDADLIMANLQGADLHMANLQRADVRGAKLQRASLSKANLQKGKLTAADLQRANLVAANLEGANLEAADLQGAYLTAANLRGSRLYQGNLQRANLCGANLEAANVTRILFCRSSRQQGFRGIRVATCYGSQIFKSFAQDQDYIEELRASGRLGNLIFWIWWLFADCGRSLGRWALWSVGFAAIFGFIYYYGLGASHI